MPVNATRKEYDKALNKWKLVRAIIENDAMDFIREVDPNDKVRTDQYKQDAILTNFTKLTKTGLIGLVYKKPTEIKLPEPLQYLTEDATGTKFGLEQFSQQVMGEVLMTGRLGLLIDYPKPNEGEDPKDDDGTNVSRLKPYVAESIINWQYRVDGSESKLCLVVLKETISKQANPNDMFKWEDDIQYRVLYLNTNNEYQQSVWDAQFQMVGPWVTPIDYNGKAFEEIPFIFIGSENNDPSVDPIPLYDLAILNLGHYRNSADYEESIFVTGQPTVFLAVEGSQDEFKVLYPNGINFGSRAGYNLGPNGRAELLQANPNQLVAQAMAEKLKEAAALGARLISPAGGRETAEAAKIRYGAQNSALYTITHNIALAFVKALWYVSRFMQEMPEDSTFVLNDQYYEDAADPNLIAQQIMLLDRQVISSDDIRDYLRDTGVISEERSNEAITKDAKADPLAGLGLLPPDNGSNQSDPQAGVEGSGP